jgi:Uma2 family endonuclease
VTIADREAEAHPGLLAYLDEQGLRYEVLDGAVIVSPPLPPAHERAMMRVLEALLRDRPAGIEVFPAGIGCYYQGTSFVLPDVCAVLSEDVEPDGIHRPPLLAVEVRSPSTHRRDAMEKREIYAEWGVPSYWLVDPRVGSMTVLTLQHGAYVETARGTRLEVHEPYPVLVDLS